MRLSGLLSLLFLATACGGLSNGASKNAVFSEADTKSVTRKALDYVVEHMPPDACLKTRFRTDIIELTTAGVLQMDPVPEITEIPPNWLPFKARLCGAGNGGSPTIEIGRPTFARVQIKNKTIDVADTPVLFACGAGHLCSETSGLSYSRHRGSEWKFEEYRRYATGM